MAASQESLGVATPRVDGRSVLLGTLATVGLAAAGFILGVGAAGKAGTTQSFWYLSRSAGLVAYMLLWGSVIWGLLLSARSKRFKPAGLFDAHQFLSNVALGFMFFHALVLVGDRYLSFPLTAILVPFVTDYKPLLVAAGQLALWLTVLLGLSVLFRKQIGVRRFRIFHYTSFLAYWLALFHAIWLGSDTNLPVVQGMYAISALAVVVLTAWRILVRPSTEAATVQNA